ncbi:MAG: AMP-binding protein [Planctomycetes bacterium]|nr:AMP-binding protein [Planctomycetota bacterium]
MAASFAGAASRAVGQTQAAFSESGLLLPLGLTALALLLLCCWLRPLVPVRFFLWLLTRTLYRLKVSGRRNVPPHGAALLVCNQLHYLDWLLLLIAVRRPVHFFLFAGWTRRWGVRHLLRWAGAITLDADAGPRHLVRALRAAADCLHRGELVCVFTEGQRTARGLTLPFSRTFRQVTRRCAVPILPVCVAQKWGSLFRIGDGKTSWMRPQEMPYPAWVQFGEALPPGTPAGEVRQAVQRLSAAAAARRSDEHRPVHRQFVRMACRHPFRTCLVDSSRKEPPLTYGKVLAGALCLTRHLRPVLGDAAMVGVWLPPGAGGAFSNIALAFLGKTSVNLNYTASPEAVQSALRQCHVRHVLTARRFLHRVPLDPGPGVELIYLDELLPRISSGEKTRAFLKVLFLPRFVLERWVLGLGRHAVEDPATIIFSSGSTGDPKGVVLTHRNVASNVESMVQATGLTRYDRALGVLPFFHSFGYTVTLWAPLAVGASAVYHADPRQAKEIGELCNSHKCTIFLNTATFLRFCLKKCEADDFRSVRILMCGAEKLPPALAEEFKDRFGVLPLEGYGCTELSPAAAANLPDEEIDGCVQINNKTGTIGPPLPGVAARVVDPDTFVPLPAGTEGLLLIRGPNVMAGYLNRPDLTEKVMIGGEYATGDMARIDEDGFITLTGRLSRFAKIGGEMVPLEKIEEELHGLLQTAERVLAVASVPDEKKGERLVVLHLSLDSADARQLSKGLSERGLPNLWVPGERDFYPIDHLPVLGSGKLDLKQVKEMALSAVQGSPAPV